MTRTPPQDDSDHMEDSDWRSQVFQDCAYEDKRRTRVCHRFAKIVSFILSYERISIEIYIFMNFVNKNKHTPAYYLFKDIVKVFIFSYEMY